MIGKERRSIELSGVAAMASEQLVDSIDQEILELEELINLQRRKVELLRKKNAIKTVESKDEGITKAEENKSEESAKEGTFSPLRVPEKERDESVKWADESSKPSPTRASVFNSPSSSSKQLSLISSMQRMSRLSTDLANERNLLAWARTAMAAGRTAMTFLGLTGNTNFGVGLVYTTSIGFGVLAVWMTVQGILRYKKVKEILMLPEPPLFFGRLSNVPVTMVMLALLVFLVIGNSSDQWTK